MSAAVGEQEPQPEKVPTDRLLTLPDGVVAIALTLLILDIKVPDSTKVLADPDSVSQLAAWLAHAGGLAAWNFLFLFTVSVMPFTSHLIGQFAENPLSVMIFSANLILANVAIHAMLTFSRRRHLLDGTGLAIMASYRSLAGVIDLCLYAVSIPIALVSPDGAKLCWLGLALSAPIAAQVDKLRARRHAAV